MLSLKGLTALVTGGTQGIGWATVDTLLRLGANVAFVSRTDAQVREKEVQWREHEQGFSVLGLTADVSDEAVCQDICQQVIDTFKGLDILVNNVGTNIRKDTLDYTAADLEKIMATNVASAWAMTRCAFPHLNASPSASVVNVSSVASMSALLTSSALYSASKAAMNQLTRSLAVEWAPLNIRVNTVMPGYTETPLVSRVLDDEVLCQKVVDTIPLGRVGDPQDVANVIAFLASPMSSYMTGTAVPVDGGFLASGIR